MECQVIGEANPDIAGIGILIAFVIQSLIAVIVSAYTWILSSKIKARWDAVNEDSPESRPDLPGWLESIFGKHQHLLDRLKSTIQPAQYNRRQFAWEDWLYGKQPAEPRRWTPDSKIEDETTPTTRRLELANRILLAGSDAQTFTGIALLISALIQSNSMSLYHMHIIYDATSLVIISNCAASICIFSEGRIKGQIRLGLMVIWAVLFVAYFSIFAKRLQTWDLEIPFHCYRTTAIARPNHPHPYVDNIYIGITFFFIAGSFSYAVSLAVGGPLLTTPIELFYSLDTLISKYGADTTTPISSYVRNFDIARRLMSIITDEPIIFASELQMRILAIAMLQCPLHIYSIFALRASNERYLEAGGSEREWGFGQIAAVVLLAGNLLPIVDGVAGLSHEHRRRVLEVLERAEEQSTSHPVRSQGAPQPDNINQKERPDAEIAVRG